MLLCVNVVLIIFLKMLSSERENTLSLPQPEKGNTRCLLFLELEMVIIANSVLLVEKKQAMISLQRMAEF